MSKHPREVLLTPGPVTLSHAVRREMLRDRPSHGDDVKSAVREAARTLVRIANAGDGYAAIPLPGSATYANEALIRSFVPADGKILLVSNGTYGDRLAAICDIIGLAPVLVRTPDRVPFPVEAVRAALTSHPAISHVMMVHCETSGGILNPLASVDQLCRAFGKALLVDAVSSFGAIPIDLTGLRIQALSISSNKCLEGPPGLAWVIADRAALDAGAGRACSLSLDLREQWAHLERSGCFRFTPPTHAVMGFAQALRDHEEEGGAPVRLARYWRNWRRLVARMEGIGIEALVKEPVAVPIVGVFTHPDDPAYEFGAFCSALAARGYHLFPGSGAVPDSIRIGCIGQIGEADIDGMADAAADILKRRRPSSVRLNGQSAGRAGPGAAGIVQRSLVWDAHSCMPLLPGIDLSALQRHRAAGVNYVSLNVGMDMTPAAMVVQVLAHFRDWLLARPEQYVLVRSVADVRRAAATGKLAVGFDLEGALPLSGDLAMVQLYAGLGVRQMHFVYNRNNPVGGGCHDVDVPLTGFGRALVGEVNRVGLILDCSHTGYRSSLEIMEMSTKPVVFSHSNVRMLCEHARNIGEEQIRACAATGGVIGITGFGPLLGAAEAETMAAHIDRVAQLVGPSHVGIGLDYVFLPDVDDMPKGIDRAYWWPPQGGYGSSFAALPFIQPEQLETVAEHLAAWGYGETDLGKILGLNFLRVAEETWQPRSEAAERAGQTASVQAG